MNLAQQEIHIDASDIVCMYCYICLELKNQLRENVRDEIKVLAERFRQKYIGYEYTLFNEKYYQQVIDSLKDALEIIDKQTPLKDPDYWHFYDAIEAFLFRDLHHSQEGEIWGINNFHSVWEAMCLTFLIKNIIPDFLLYKDTKFISTRVLSNFKSNSKFLDFSKIFIVNGSELRPDAVIISSHETDSPGISSGQASIKYQIRRDIVRSTGTDWNDYGYYTLFELEGNRSRVRIAYANQSTGDHTFNKLIRFGQRNDNTLILTSLPDKFYSYWSQHFDDLSIE